MERLEVGVKLVGVGVKLVGTHQSTAVRRFAIYVAVVNHRYRNPKPPPPPSLPDVWR